MNISCHDQHGLERAGFCKAITAIISIGIHTSPLSTFLARSFRYPLVHANDGSKLKAGSPRFASLIGHSGLHGDMNNHIHPSQCLKAWTVKN